MINERELTLTELFDKISDRLKEALENSERYKLKLDTEYEYWEGYSTALDWVHDMLLLLINDK